MRMMLVIVTTAVLVAACAGDNGGGAGNPPTPRPAQASSAAQPTAGPANTAPAGTGNRNASIQFSGGVAGTLTVQGLTCGPGALVSISGTIGSAQYTIEASAPAVGTVQLSSTGASGVILIETAPSFRRWAAGAGQQGGSGSLTFDQRSGQLNAEVVGIQGNQGTVRLQGNWSCP
jgi:hypothetical protein